MDDSPKAAGRWSQARRFVAFHLGNTCRANRGDGLKSGIDASGKPGYLFFRTQGVGIPFVLAEVVT